jgi:hypothetical protein
MEGILGVNLLLDCYINTINKIKVVDFICTPGSLIKDTKFQRTQ